MDLLKNGKLMVKKVVSINVTKHSTNSALTCCHLTLYQSMIKVAKTQNFRRRFHHLEESIIEDLLFCFNKTLN